MPKISDDTGAYVAHLHSEGRTTREIAAALRAIGVDVSHDTVARWLRDAGARREAVKAPAVERSEDVPDLAEHGRRRLADAMDRLLEISLDPSNSANQQTQAAEACGQLGLLAQKAAPLKAKT